MERVTKAAAAILLGIFLSAASVQSPPADAVQRLSKTGVFAFGGVGFIGKISQGEIDFRAIGSQPPEAALKSFEEVFAGGDAAGKLYALAGIRTLNEKRSKELIKPLESSQQKVFTMQGCIMESTTMATIATAIDSGNYDSRLKALDRQQ